jgi:hypothetical protein
MGVTFFSVDTESRRKTPLHAIGQYSKRAPS